MTVETGLLFTEGNSIVSLYVCVLSAVVTNKYFHSETSTGDLQYNFLRSLLATSYML